MQVPKKSRGTNCRINCPGRVVENKSRDEKSSMRNNRGKKQYRIKQRQYLVYKPEEEIYHEPYMQPLRGKFSSSSITCDSKIELPWKDIMAEGGRAEKRKDDGECGSRSSGDDFVKLSGKESTGSMKLPWNDLVIDETFATLHSRKTDDTARCDSSLEIPWDELTLESPITIKPVTVEKTCSRDVIEIPWDAIFLPKNIIIQSDKKIKHPSSSAPSRKDRKRLEKRGCSLDCPARK